MQLTFQQISYFRNCGQYYRLPQGSNILGRINVSIILEAAVSTLEHFLILVRFSFFRMDEIITRAGLRRACKWNPKERDSCDISLVLNKDSKLIERPAVCFTSLRLALQFLVQTISNAGQIFKSKRSLELFRFLGQLPRDAVVNVFLKALFSARELSQQPSRAVSASRLNMSSDSCVSIPGCLKLLTIPGATGACTSNISSAQINPNYLWRFTCRLAGDVYHNVDVIVALARFVQGCTGRLLALQQGNPIPTNGKLEGLLSRFRGGSHRLSVFRVFEGTGIQADRNGAESVNPFNRFGIANHAPKVGRYG